MKGLKPNSTPHTMTLREVADRSSLQPCMTWPWSSLSLHALSSSLSFEPAAHNVQRALCTRHNLVPGHQASVTTHRICFTRSFCFTLMLATWAMPISCETIHAYEKTRVYRSAASQVSFVILPCSVVEEAGDGMVDSECSCHLRTEPIVKRKKEKK